MLKKRTEEQIQEMQKEVIGWCKEFEEKRNMDLDICIEKAKKGLNCKEAILKELNQGKVAKFKVETISYCLDIQIKQVEGE